MHRNAILLVWIGGIAVAALAYAAGPDALLDRSLDVLAAGLAAFAGFIRDLSTLGSTMMRAFAVGLFAVFVALAILTIRQGGKGKTALIVISVTFLLLLHDGGEASNPRWAAAFVLAAIGAMVMTGRVRRGGPP